MTCHPLLDSQSEADEDVSLAEAGEEVLKKADKKPNLSLLAAAPRVEVISVRGK